MAGPKKEIEQALLAEAIDSTDYGRSFSRIFNKDNGDFSRIFSRGGAQLADISAHELASMDEATFKKLAERFQALQKDFLAEHQDTKKR